jgi:predicted flap endonuclease-1-like 5' DNA nuclease
LSQARQLWRGFNLLKRQRKAGKPKTPPPPAVEAFPVMAEEDLPSDDLTAIQGIGSRLQEHLNEVGIYAFAQLAESTPEDLRNALGRAARLGKVEEWIEQARELART